MFSASCVLPLFLLPLGWRRLLPSSLLFPCPSWQTKTFVAFRAHWQLELKIKKMVAGATFYLLNI